MDALAREAGERRAELLRERRAPTRLAQRETGYAGAGVHSNRQQINITADAEEIPQAGAPSPSVSVPAPSPAPAGTVGDFDAVAAAAANKERLRQARRSSNGGRRPSLEPPNDNSETPARVRNIPARHRGVTAITKKVFADKPVSLVARNSKRDRETAAAAAATGEERGGEEGASKGAREYNKGTAIDVRRPLPRDKTSLVDTASAEEKAEEEDEGDIPGRTSRGVSRNSSLSKMWPSASPALTTGRNLSHVSGGPLQPQGQANPTQRVAVAEATSEKEAGLSSVLGTPSGEISAENIEARLDRLRGTLSLPRVISND